MNGQRGADRIWYFRCAALNAACVVPMLSVAVWKLLGMIVWFAKPSFSSRSCASPNSDFTCSVDPVEAKLPG